MQATSHYLNQCWLSSAKHICSTMGRWVKLTISQARSQGMRSLGCLLDIFSSDQAALRTLLSVLPSVRLWHLFHNVPLIISSWNYRMLLPLTKVISMQKVKVGGQRSRSQRSKQILPPPPNQWLDWTVTPVWIELNWPMAMKWYTKLEVV